MHPYDKEHAMHRKITVKRKSRTAKKASFYGASIDDPVVDADLEG